MTKKMDCIFGIIFAVATVVFVILFLTNDIFFNWAFARHHNVLSWYIRPLFIIPIIVFAFKKSLTGIFATIFALFTSMFWFPSPETSSPQIMTFLAYEMEYLKGEWTTPKIIMSLTVPMFFIALILAAWKRNWRLLLGVVIGAAILKIAWSVIFSGEAGMTILKPAIIGLIFCIAGIYIYKKSQTASKKI
ncbi:hypothetical protein EHE19_012780 [Ruminiclostridium herbifermentans]|uniref:Uncharacterized protein n=1 Tax=Ruminiclostridium herbifermentans TaxID=2488810 RepID=A0A4U7JG62_9FIRM|nr:hypothetical protein [Ruminiclostridium herbifermentans]QNU65779.1 hypothetical protein EHE19_012780 [Ruminiclostridium herbifermentans]